MTTPIRALKPNEVYETIQARVCRIWTNNDFVTGRLISLDCILVDEEDTLRPGEILSANKTSVSPCGVFELGFFPFGKVVKQYLGIWLKDDKYKKAVWVANQDSPLVNNSAILYIRDDGNSVVKDSFDNPTDLVQLGHRSCKETVSCSMVEPNRSLKRTKSKDYNFSFVSNRKEVYLTFSNNNNTHSPSSWFELSPNGEIDEKSVRGNQTIYVRGGALVDSDNQRMRDILLKFLLPVMSLILIFTVIFFLCRLTAGNSDRTGYSGTNNDIAGDSQEFSRENIHQSPLLSFSSIEDATCNFSFANKLGDGGFGPVYKGNLSGLDIAVKRLSKSSGQGLEEFRNEIEKEGRYWGQRMHTIEGIAQGLLYLHKYSRAWNLWKDDRVGELMDPTWANSCRVNELQLCIQVALLCIQEDPEDRPTMSDVVSMLGNERTILPDPNQPGLSTYLSLADIDSPRRLSGPSQINVTMSEFEAR
ncbi:G-type lectin S-receptor-like serine/threonine-protein kinase RKS1 [Morus notabilis]|uniref:G-type lectin S-receptor-like serine/threonine-protein kinase RKS1 n=1 Tax=Morus notabilis TaxID=981085 RepID=W9RX17_9ROSA|nr:G-type lectin S-receptor-like serine/threonine-protein kinase RKS1 [Morus notabilis]